MKSTKNWLDLVAESKRNATQSGTNSSDAVYLDLLRKRVRGSARNSSGSSPTDSKLGPKSRPVSYRPTISRGG